MIIDVHAHFEPRMLDVPKMVAKLDEVGVDRVALIPAMNDPLPHTPERLLAVARRLSQSRITRPLVEGFHRTTLTAEGDLRLSGKVFGIYARPDNAAVARAIAARPDRFFGWIFLNPRNNPGVLDELDQWRAVPGMIGIKLHPHWHDWRTEIATPLLRRAEELGLPVLVHLGFGPRGDFRAICDRFPRLKVISAHAGFPFYGDLWKHAAQHPNLYVDLSSPYIDERLARSAVAAMGAERCLYGTDAPYGFHEPDGSYDYREIRRWVEHMPISSAEQQRIFGDTFAEMIGL
jgi:predicted TIM-barrel fold metal-dependent hydrolase